MKARSLKNLPIFASLPAAELGYLAKELSWRRAEPGELLYREGDRKKAFYIMLGGEVEIIKGLGSPDERLLGVRGAGSFLGEMRLFSRDHCHTASVRARTPLEMLELSDAQFGGLVERHPEFTFELLRALSVRLDESENLTIRDLREKNRQLSQAYDELKAAQAQLIETERLERELEVARQIQSSLLPRSLPSHQGYDFSACMLPMRAVGGDFYDFISLDEDLLGIAVGDVMDHGVPAALLMALTVTLLRVEARRSPSPRKVVANVNRQLLERNDLGIFATLLYGILDVTSGRFKYVRAGHELPVLLDGDGRVTRFQPGCGQPLGLLADPCLDVHEVDLVPGSLILLFTDGVKETSDPSGQLFGMDRLTAQLQGQPARSAADTCQGVIQALARFRQSTPQSDDITLLAIRATP
jgi:sigma-B regulation protein RsbU (phosphoserine phosphatase)